MTRKRSKRAQNAGGEVLEQAVTPAEERIEPLPAPPAAMRRSVEAWRSEKRTPVWAFEAAKMMHGWPIGRVLDEAAYDAAIDAARSVELRSPALRTRTTTTRKRG